MEGIGVGAGCTSSELVPAAGCFNPSPVNTPINNVERQMNVHLSTGSALFAHKARNSEDRGMKDRKMRHNEWRRALPRALVLAAVMALPLLAVHAARDEGRALAAAGGSGLTFVRSLHIGR